MELDNGDGMGYTEQATEDVNGIRKEMREGFKRVDEQFVQMRRETNARFEKIDEGFGRMEHRISLIFTFLGVGFTILAALITLFQFMD